MEAYKIISIVSLVIIVAVPIYIWWDVHRK